MAGGEKKRVSEIERERAGHAVGEMMKAEPIEFAAKPASGEFQYKELSEQENPIVGEEVAAEYVGEMSGGNRFEAFQRFDTVREVVEAFAITYNDDSIRNNREYGGYTTTVYLKRNMAGGEKKRVSEIERERGQVQLMKLEPMEFSGEPASGELQHKELSKQENPIVGEEVAAEYVGEMSGGNRFEAFQRFDTVRKVVEAFAITYNDDSIRNNREYGATIYKDRDGKYSYSTPNEGTEANIWMYTLPENKEDDVVALVHSHGSTTSHDNENLSKDDISTADNYQIPVYVVTPGGKIQKYDPKGQRTRINAPTVNPAIPSDPKAGNDRLTEVDPSTGVDNPSIPKYQQVEPPPSNKK